MGSAGEHAEALAAMLRRIPIALTYLVLKVWHDVVDDGLGERPFDPSEIVADVDARLLPPEDIGLLTRPVEPEAWLSNVRSRHEFVTAPDDAERRVARCNPGDRYEVSQLVLALTGHG